MVFKPYLVLNEEGFWKWELGPAVVLKGRTMARLSMRPPASPSCRLYEPEAVGAIGAYPPACKPTGWPPARRGTILRLGEKRPRREGGIRNAEGTDTRFIILNNTIGPQSHDFALL